MNKSGKKARTNRIRKSATASRHTTSKPIMDKQATRRTGRHRRLFALVSLLAVVIVLACLLKYGRQDTTQPDDPAQAVGEGAAPWPQVSFEEPAYSADATADDLKHEAIGAANTLVEMHPDDVASLTVAARLQSRLGNSEAALELWRRCTELDQDCVDAFFRLGSSARDRGDFSTAALMMRRVLERAPGHVEAEALLGDSLLQSGEVEEAVVVLEQHVQNPAAMDAAFLSLGQAHLQQKDFSKAEQAYQRLVAANPHNGRAYYGLARVYALRGEREKSQEYRRKFQSLTAVDYEQRARDLREYTDLPMLRGLLAETLWQCGQIYHQRAELDQAEEMWLKAAIVQPHDVRCRHELLCLYEAQNRTREALRTCDELCQIEPERASHWLNAGVLYGRLQQLDDAQVALKKAIQLDPHNSEYRKAYELVKQGR